jgi:sugar phosphate isomerase/epimerase
MTQPRISVQLYTLRDQIAELGMAHVLERVASFGYDGVELAGVGDLTPARVRTVCQGLGLSISSAHVTLPAGPDAAAVLDEQEELGNTIVIAGGTPDEVATPDDVSRLVEQFNHAAANAAERGMTVGYHNHWWEFEAAAYDRLVAELVPSIFMEVDIYWAQVGQRDPATLVASLGPRARYLHVKDGPISPRMPMVAVGDGAVDVAGVLAAGNGVQWHVVELDLYDGDMFDAVERSHPWLAKWQAGRD